MANRVLLDTSGLKVSKPGVNVLTASTSGLQFSSDWSALAFYRREELDCNWNEAGYRNFSLGKTFPTPPIVQFQLVNSSSSVSTISSINSFYIADEDAYFDDNGFYVLNWYHRLEAIVTTSQIRIKSGRDGSGWPPFRLRYTVLDYNL